MFWVRGRPTRRSETYFRVNHERESSIDITGAVNTTISPARTPFCMWSTWTRNYAPENCSSKADSAEKVSLVPGKYEKRKSVESIVTFIRSTLCYARHMLRPLACPMTSNILAIAPASLHFLLRAVHTSEPGHDSQWSSIDAVTR